jgi:hypothetical protein
MKKLLSVGVAAVLIALGTSRPADAWCNAKFSIGLNWSCQSGNNNLFWGLWRNGEIPSDYGAGGYGPGAMPGPGASGGQPFPWFGGNNATGNMPQAAAALPAQSGYAAANYYGNNPYYAASYQPNQQASYQAPYYAPNYAPNYTPGYYGTDPFTWFYQR